VDWNWELGRTFFASVVSIFAVVNALGNLPVFVGLTEHIEPVKRRKLFRLAGVTALAIILAMGLVGEILMNVVFHVEVDREFAFAGGLTLIVIGIRNILGNHTAPPPSDEEHQREAEIRLAVSPIAIPLLVGPGSIVTVMLIASSYGRPYALAASVMAFVFVLAVLNWAHVLNRLMGRVGSLAVGRVMQIFIIAIGVKFCFTGLMKMFPALAG
jgi:multiple antibiotic resistance protein